MILLGPERGNLYQIPNIVLRWGGEASAVTQIASLTTTLDGARGESGKRILLLGKDMEMDIHALTMHCSSRSS